MCDNDVEAEHEPARGGGGTHNSAATQRARAFSLRGHSHASPVFLKNISTEEPGSPDAYTCAGESSSANSSGTVGEPSPAILNTLQTIPNDSGALGPGSVAAEEKDICARGDRSFDGAVRTTQDSHPRLSTAGPTLAAR